MTPMVYHGQRANAGCGTCRAATVMAPSAFADDENLSLNATIVDAPDKGWYGSGDVVEILQY